jgi:hypothetical protein
LQQKHNQEQPQDQNQNQEQRAKVERAPSPAAFDFDLLQQKQNQDNRKITTKIKSSGQKWSGRPRPLLLTLIYCSRSKIKTTARSQPKSRAAGGGARSTHIRRAGEMRGTPKFGPL